MFGIFKNPKKVNEFTDKEITFFKEVIKLLPIRYHYIINQLNKNFLISFKPNDLSFKDWYSVQLNAKLEKEYSKPSLGYFQLQNILIFNKRTKIKEKLTLSFLEGMFIGFYIQDARFDNYILSEYDISGLKEKHFKNDGDKNDLLKIIGDINKEQLLQFDLEYSFKI